MQRTQWRSSKYLFVLYSLVWLNKGSRSTTWSLEHQPCGHFKRITYMFDKWHIHVWNDTKL